MTKMTAKYLGGLRVECVHLPSGVKLITDAPVDNQGKGEAFSPTDLLRRVAGSLYPDCIGDLWREASGGPDRDRSGNIQRNGQ